MSMAEVKRSEKWGKVRKIGDLILNWITRKFEWSGGTYFVSTLMKIIGTGFLLPGLIIAYASTRHSLNHFVCHVHTNPGCVMTNRTGSVILLLLGSCFLLGARVLHQLRIEATVVSSEGSAEVSNEYHNERRMNPNAIRLAASIALYGTPIFAIYLLVTGLKALPQLAFHSSLHSWEELTVVGSFTIASFVSVAELIANRRMIGNEVVNWKTVVVWLTSLYGFLLTRRWAEWSWGNVALVITTVGGFAALAHWLTKRPEVHRSDPSAAGPL
jgi:hypothetical protein